MVILIHFTIPVILELHDEHFLCPPTSSWVQESLRVFETGAIIQVTCDIHVNDVQLRCNISRLCEN